MSGTSIRDVRVFTGTGLTEPADITITDGIISAVPAPADADIVDGKGGVLLPGLIDTHVHVDKASQLDDAVRWGVTTLCDMGSRDLDLLASLRGRLGKPTVLSAGYPASSPGSMVQTNMHFPAASTVAGPEDADRFVTERKTAGSDYIKIILEDARMPGSKPFDPETVVALVTAAHEHGLKTVAHLVSPDTLRAALNARVDIVTHTAINGELGPDLDELVRERDAAIIPTLGMMNGVITTVGRRLPLRVIGLLIPRARMRYEKAEATVRIFRDAGKTVLAGTDANDDPTTPYQLAIGSSLHDELERLVHASLTPAEALRAATSDAARVFGLPDRGTIEPGKRADLLLVNGDPTTDIAATRDIAGVWIAGERVR